MDRLSVAEVKWLAGTDRLGAGRILLYFLARTNPTLKKVPLIGFQRVVVTIRQAVQKDRPTRPQGVR
jgi:hypothetical protein